MTIYEALYEMKGHVVKGYERVGHDGGPSHGAGHSSDAHYDFHNKGFSLTHQLASHYRDYSPKLSKHFKALSDRHWKQMQKIKG